VKTRTATLDVSLYSGDPEARRDIGELDLGGFLRQFVEAPRDFAVAGTPGGLRLEAEWPRPWELSVHARLHGDDAFLRGLLAGLGRRLAGWLAEQVSRLGRAARPEVRFGDVPVRTLGRVDVGAPGRAAEVLELGLVNALSSERLHVIVEPGA
jgi:hypothetical protein